jgi:hypothetical protein
MKLKIIDTDRGQTPYTIKEALAVSSITRNEISWMLKKSGQDRILFSPGTDFSCNAGYHFQLEAVK